MKGNHRRLLPAAACPLPFAELSAAGSVFVGLSVTSAVIDRIQSGASKTELMSTWKFGCPADPTQARTAAAASMMPACLSLCGLALAGCWACSFELPSPVPFPLFPLQFMSECGWQLQLATDRARQAAALGLDPALCSFPAGGAFFAEAGGSDKGASLFLVATNRANAA